MEGLEGRDVGWLWEELLREGVVPLLLKLLELLVQEALLLLMDLLLLLLFHLVGLFLLLLLLGGEADLVLLLVAVLLLQVSPLSQLPLLEFGLLLLVLLERERVDCGIGVDSGLRSPEPSGRGGLGGPVLLRLLLESGGRDEGVGSRRLAEGDAVEWGLLLGEQEGPLLLLSLL